MNNSIRVGVHREGCRGDANAAEEEACEEGTGMGEWTEHAGEEGNTGSPPTEDEQNGVCRCGGCEGGERNQQESCMMRSAGFAGGAHQEGDEGDQGEHRHRDCIERVRFEPWDKRIYECVGGRVDAGGRCETEAKRAEKGGGGSRGPRRCTGIEMFGNHRSGEECEKSAGDPWNSGGIHRKNQ